MSTRRRGTSASRGGHRTHSAHASLSLTSILDAYPWNSLRQTQGMVRYKVWSDTRYDACLPPTTFIASSVNSGYEHEEEETRGHKGEDTERSQSANVFSFLIAAQYTVCISIVPLS